MYAKVGDRVKSPYGYDLEIIDTLGNNIYNHIGNYITILCFLQ